MPGKEAAIAAVMIGFIMTVISIILILFMIGNEGVGAIYVILIITLIIDFVLLIGFLVLILAATRGS